MGVARSTPFGVNLFPRVNYYRPLIQMVATVIIAQILRITGLVQFQEFDRDRIKRVRINATKT